MTRTHVAVIGAGAFGGWTALHLLRNGSRVTLLDAWGPANPRASSGDDTRVIRHTYNARPLVDLVARSVALWREHGERWGVPLFECTGMLWSVSADESYENDALRHLSAAGIPHEILDPQGIARRFPQWNAAGVRWAIHEPLAGFLRARLACETLVREFQREGGEYRQVAARPGAVSAGAMQGVELSDGTRLVADHYVFACGPWLGELFPGVIGTRIQPTRQEVFYFELPAGFGAGLPVWGDHGEHFWYGIPDAANGRMKVASDTWGAPFDPTRGDRTPSAEGERAARECLELRFPALRGAPLLNAGVCQYETTPDNRFIVDRHPAASNAWLVGGGSGHGFKHGPALGEQVARAVLGEGVLDPMFTLARLGG